MQRTIEYLIPEKRNSPNVMFFTREGDRFYDGLSQMVIDLSALQNGLEKGALRSVKPLSITLGERVVSEDQGSTYKIVNSRGEERLLTLRQ